MKFRYWKPNSAMITGTARRSRKNASGLLLCGWGESVGVGVGGGVNMGKWGGVGVGVEVSSPGGVGVSWVSWVPISSDAAILARGVGVGWDAIHVRI